MRTIVTANPAGEKIETKIRQNEVIKFPCDFPGSLNFSPSLDHRNHHHLKPVTYSWRGLIVIWELLASQPGHIRQRSNSKQLQSEIKENDQN